MFPPPDPVTSDVPPVDVFTLALAIFVFDLAVDDDVNDDVDDAAVVLVQTVKHSLTNASIFLKSSYRPMTASNSRSLSRRSLRKASNSNRSSCFPISPDTSCSMLSMVDEEEDEEEEEEEATRELVFCDPRPVGAAIACNTNDALRLKLPAVSSVSSA